VEKKYAEVAQRQREQVGLNACAISAFASANTAVHRRQKYGGSSLNSLQPISYFGSIWELYVLAIKTKVFCRKKN
jgi:hypothetical protein